jgi:hypothetical protein
MVIERAPAPSSLPRIIGPLCGSDAFLSQRSPFNCEYLGAFNLERPEFIPSHGNRRRLLISRSVR